MSVEKADLHIHTKYSDGTLMPKDIIELAKKKQLSIISITDHDTIMGCKEAIKLGKSIGIKVIPGIELSIDFERELHLLGYGIDINNKELNTYLKLKSDMNFSELIKFLRKIQKKYPNIKREEIFSIKKVNVTTIIDYMVKKGYIEGKNEAYRYFFNDVNAVKRKLNIREGIELIKDAGGIPVLAHPGRIGYDYEKLYSVLVKLKEMGLEGIECYHKSHSKNDIEKFVNMAKKLNMKITGGSDFHYMECDNIDVYTYNFEINLFNKDKVFLKYIF